VKTKKIMAVKQFSIKVSEELLEEFERINSELSSSTKGETFGKLLENFRNTLGNPEEYQQEYQRKTEEYQQEIQRNTEEIRQEYQRNTEEIRQEYQRKTEEYQQEYRKEYQQENQRKVVPKWYEIGNTCAEINGFPDVDSMLWHLFCSWTKHNLDHGLKRVPSKTIDEITEKYKN
jgi:Skp family chaperone for outer membrane proteins